MTPKQLTKENGTIQIRTVPLRIYAAVSSASCACSRILLPMKT